MTDAERDDLARYYGFGSFAELLAISNPLPKQPGDTVQSYVARRANGQWFVWQEAPAPKHTLDDPSPMRFLKPDDQA